MKKTLILFSLAFALTCNAQPNPWNSGGGSTAPAPTSAKPQETTTNVNNSHALDSNTFERTQNNVFDFNSDSVNFEDGTVNWKGKTFNVGNSRVVRARFERYLATDLRSQNFKNYETILKDIQMLLAANSEEALSESVRKAWSKLYDASEYDIDNDGCLTIANTVYSVFRFRKDYQVYKLEQDWNLQNQKRLAIATASENRANEIAKEKKEYSQYQRESSIARAGGKGGAKSDANAGTNEIPPLLTGASIMNKKELVDALAKEAALKTGKSLLETKAILMFQSQTMTFLLSRRFQHAAISAQFYRHLYKSQVQDYQVGKEEFEQFFPSNVLPNNDLFESLASEAKNDVREGMIAVNNLYDSNQRYNALMRLMETFFLGENEPAVRSFDYEKKVVLHGLYRDLSAMKDMADYRDFDGILKILEHVKTIASDFPMRETLSKIQVAQQASNLKVMQARSLAFRNDVEGASAALKEAAEIWPLNPALEKFNNEVMELTIGVSKYETRFDELLEKNAYREIMGDAAEYGLALKNSPEKLKKLKEIVSNVSQIDFLIAQAKELQTQGNSYIAWEMLEKAAKIDPADAVLARAMMSLAPHVADYVKVLNKAKQSEAAGKYAMALSNYLQAQDIFPLSQDCRLGVERCAQKTLANQK